MNKSYTSNHRPSEEVDVHIFSRNNPRWMHCSHCRCAGTTRYQSGLRLPLHQSFSGLSQSGIRNRSCQNCWSLLQSHNNDYTRRILLWTCCNVAFWLSGCVAVWLRHCSFAALPDPLVRGSPSGTASIKICGSLRRYGFQVLCFHASLCDSQHCLAISGYLALSCCNSPSSATFSLALWHFRLSGTLTHRLSGSPSLALALCVHRVL